MGQGIGDKSGNRFHFGLFQTMSGGSWGTDPDAGSDEGRTGLEGNGVLVHRYTRSVEGLFGNFTGHLHARKIDQHEVVISASGNQPEALFLETLRQCRRVPDDLLLVNVELGSKRLL